ncbi:methyltransferase, TIGR04325 family [Bosea sp. NPDC055332]
MSVIASLKQTLRLTAHPASTSWPGIVELRQRLYEARFRAGRYHCGYSGKYPSFDAAERALPTGLSGFDHDAMADIDHYTTMAGGIEPMPATEYPVLFWLHAALGEGARTLLDLGGYVGHAFRQYDRYLAFPDEFRWAVFDLPHITRAGQALAAQQPTPRLCFTNAVDDGCGMDVLLAAGSLQYLPEHYLHERLNAWKKRPRHLIVQRRPLHAQHSFTTIQSVITRTGQVSFCPYSVPSRTSFIDCLVALGYELVDSWEKPRSLDVPFHPECHVETYSGLYFRLRP